MTHIYVKHVEVYSFLFSPRIRCGCAPGDDALRRFQCNDAHLYVKKLYSWRNQGPKLQCLPYHIFGGHKYCIDPSNVKSEYRVIKSEYRVIKGEYRVKKGEYRVIKGEYRVIKSEYRVIKSEYRVIKGEYRVIKS